ncbi:hypothetical protein SNEBB_001886 [Seison nebaliae]|nr:hypothetical protein SNEBB_001886 [Seison nebaliae]
MGTAHLVGQEILLFCSVNAEQPLQAVSHLRSTVQNLTMHIALSKNLSANLEQYQLSSLQTLSFRVSRELKQLAKQILAFYFLVKRSNHVPLRTRRGLFNALGELSHTLFGTATDRQTNYLQNQLTALTSLVEEERKQLNVHSHLLNITLTSLDEFNKIRTEVNEKIQAVTESIDNFKRAEEIVTVYRDTLQSLLYMIRHSHTMLVKWRTSIFHAMRGTWDAILPEPSFVFDKLSELHNPNMMLPFNMSQHQLHNWLAVIKTHIVFQEDTLYIVLQVPTLMSSDTYQLKRAIGFPTATEVRGVCLRSLPTFSIIAISADSSAVFRDLNDCRQSLDKFYCTPSKLCPSTPYCACLNMPLNMSASIDQCAPHLSHTCSDTIQPVKNGLAYFVQNKSTAAVHCKQQPSSLIKLRNSGVIFTRGSCQITTFLGTYHISSPMKIADTFHLRLSVVNITNMFNLSIPAKSHLTHILNKGESLPLVALQKQLHIIKALRHNEILSTSHQISLYVLLVLTLIALAYLASVCIRARCMATQKIIASTIEAIPLQPPVLSPQGSIYPTLGKS